MKSLIYALTIALSASAFAHEGHLHKEDQTMAKILEQYLVVQKSLASDSQGGTKIAGQEILKLSLQLRGDEKKHAKEFLTASQKLSGAKTIEESREAFKSLSTPMVEWARRVKLPDLEVLTCSMAKASWVQKKGDVKNPFMGSKMISCGEKDS